MKYKIIADRETELVSQMESFVRAHDNCHFLQSPEWRMVKEFWDWRGIVVWDDECIVGVMSVLIRKLPFGMSILYSPRGPICDRNDHVVMKEVFAGTKILAKQRHALLLYIDPDESDDNDEFRKIMKGFSFTEKNDDGFGNIQPQYVFRLNIAKRTENDIFANFSEKTRYNIRLANRHGVRIRRFYGDEQIPEWSLAAFSQLMEITGKRNHFQVRNQAYFEKLLKAFGRDAIMFLADIDGQPIAGTIGIFYGNKGWYLYGASSNEHRNAMPNYLLQWEMICHAARRGCSVYDFRGVPGEVPKDDPLYGLYQFKKGFSGEYTKFTGLFVYEYKPVLSKVFLKALSLWKNVRK